MPITVCPFCFRKIDSSHLAYQCAGRGNVECKKEEDEAGKRLTGSKLETYPTFLPTAGTERVHQLPELRRPGESAGPARDATPRCRSTSSTPRAR